jgi:O-antigen/teichoic acid export membrane protein
MHVSMGPADSAACVEPSLSGTEVRRRAVKGAAVLVSRGALIKLIGFGGNVVLARLLVPRDFGLVAFGSTIMFMTNFIGDGGMGAALLRRPQAPTRTELGAVNGLQLAVALLVLALSGAAAVALGSDALVTTVMVSALPITALRTPSAIMLERQLSYRPMALVDIAEVVSYYSWAIPGVILGAGVWALATGTVVRAVCGTATIMFFTPVGIVLPRINVAVMRPLWRFGARVQAARLSGLARDQGINIATAGLAGVAELGVWSLAGRLMSIPALLLDTLWNVSYPAISRLRDAGEDVTGVVVRSVRLTAIGIGVLLVPLIASAPAMVPSVFGPQWHGVIDVATLLALGLLVLGPVSVSTSGFLYSIGEAGAVLRAVVASAILNLTVGVGLLALFGITGLAAGTSLAYLTEAGFLAQATRRHVHTRLLATSRPVMVSAAAIGLSINAALRLAPPTLLSALAAVALSLLVFCGSVALIANADLRLLLHTAQSLMRRRPTPAPERPRERTDRRPRQVYRAPQVTSGRSPERPSQSPRQVHRAPQVTPARGG